MAMSLKYVRENVQVEWQMDIVSQICKRKCQIAMSLTYVRENVQVEWQMDIVSQIC